jgi:hypothetical protein
LLVALYIKMKEVLFRSSHRKDMKYGVDIVSLKIL